MKKIVLCLFLFLVLFVPVYSSDIDFVVLLDTSMSMLPYFEYTMDQLIQNILNQHLENGDNFHLITFADSPELELSKKIFSKEDIADIYGKLLLLHPLGQYTDLIKALKYLDDYVSQKTLSTEKYILIVTDGIHDPPPGSPYQLDNDGNSLVSEELDRVADSMKRNGWNFHLLQYPDDVEDSSSGGSGSSGINLFPDLSEQLETDIVALDDTNADMTFNATGSQKLFFPGPLGNVKSSFSVPFEIQNFSDKPVLVNMNSIDYQGTEILRRDVKVKIPPHETRTLRANIDFTGFTAGEYAIGIAVSFRDNSLIAPKSGVLEFNLIEEGTTRQPVNYRLMIIIALAVLLLVLLFFIIRALLKQMDRKEDRIITDTSFAQAEKSLSAVTRNTEGLPSAAAPVGTQSRPGVMLTASEKSAPTALHYQGSDGKADYSAFVETIKTQQKDPSVLLQSFKPSHTQLTAATIPIRDSQSILAGYRSRQGSSPLEMRVSEQTPHIGKRNIHWVKVDKRSVGGRGSTFYIFIIPLPPRIGEIHQENDDYIFTPLKPEFFPDLSGPLHNCLNTSIRIKAPNQNYKEVHIIFREWISEAERINHILHKIDHPGD